MPPSIREFREDMHTASLTLLTGAYEVFSVLTYSFRWKCVGIGTVDVDE
jgi:hypothetical protein